MRQAIHQALIENAEVTALVGSRVYRDLGPLGQLSRQATPEAFEADGDLLLSIVIRMGPRVRPNDEPVGGAAQQEIQLWCYAERSWSDLQELARTVRGVLDGRSDLRALSEPTLNWHSTRWQSDGGEALDQNLGNRPVLVSTYAATIRETERTPA